ncbi:MAG: hypothetical protein ACRDPE_06085 [Solirubrobacterales bacterium]
MGSSSARRAFGTFSIAATLIACSLIGAEAASAVPVGSQLDEIPDSRAVPGGRFDGSTAESQKFKAEWRPVEGSPASKGTDTAGGWAPSPTTEHSGAYYANKRYVPGSFTFAARLEMAAAPEGGSFSFRIEAEPSTNTYYEAKFSKESGATYSVELLRRVDGTVPQELARQTAVPLDPGDSIAVVDAGSVVSVWTNHGGGFSQTLQVADATLGAGNIGFLTAGSGSTSTRLRNVRVEELYPGEPEKQLPKPTDLGVFPAAVADGLGPRIVGVGPAEGTVEIFTTSSCWGLPVTEGEAAEFGWPGVPVTVEDGTTTSFYVRASNTKGGQTACVGPVTYSEIRSDARPKLGNEVLANGTAFRKLPVLDVLRHYEPEKKAPGTWYAPFSLSPDGPGPDTGGGWPGKAGGASVSWSPTTFASTGPGVAVGVQIGSRTPADAPGFSLRLDGSSSGYELRFVREEGESFRASIILRQGENETVLSRATGVQVPTGSNVLFFDRNGTLAAWVGTGSSWAEVVSAQNLTYKSGEVGLSSNETYLSYFRAGNLMRFETAGPRLEATVPASPSESTTPHVLGATVYPNRTVSLFDNSTCTGTPLAEDAKGKLNFRGPAGGIPIKVPADAITNVYGSVTDEAGYASACVGPLTYSSLSGPQSEAEALAALPVLDKFDKSDKGITTNPAWEPFRWLIPQKGTSTSTGWEVPGGKVGGGIYWARSVLTETGTGVAATARLSAAPTIIGHFFSIWLSMPTPQSSETGYELRYALEEAGTFEVTLSRWEAGRRTVLASQTGASLDPGDQFAIVHREGTVSAWVDDSGLAETGPFTQILSAPDSTFEGGYAGLAGNDQTTRLQRFKAGSLAIASP